MSHFNPNLEMEMLRASPVGSVDGFQTPDKKRGAQEMQHMAYSRSLASPSVSEQRDTSHQQGPQQPTSTSSGLQELQGFSLRWEGLSETIKGQAHSSAELLMQQAAVTSQMEDFVRGLLHQLHLREEEKHRLEAQVLQDRADFTTQAKLLSQHFTLSHHRNIALQVANESLQGDLKDSREQLERETRDAFSLKQQLAIVQKELIKEHDQRMQAEAALQEHGAAIEEMQQELQHSRALCEQLHANKAQLQTQVKAMVGAEKELTENLKHTHQQIDDQLNMLRENLQQERQKRMQANKRKGELANQVGALTAELEACKAELEAMRQPQHQDEDGESDVGRKLRQALSASKSLAPGIKSTLMRKTHTIKVASPSTAGAAALRAASRTDVAKTPPQVGYTAAFAPPAAVAPRSTSKTPDSGSAPQHRLTGVSSPSLSPQGFEGLSDTAAIVVPTQAMIDVPISPLSDGSGSGPGFQKDCESNTST